MKRLRLVPAMAGGMALLHAGLAAAAPGVPLGPPLRVGNPAEYGFPVLACGGTGVCNVAWFDLRADGARRINDLRLQQLDAMGTPTGAPRTIASVNDTNVYSTQLAAAADGSLVAAWSRNATAGNEPAGAYFRRFGPDGSARGAAQRITDEPRLFSMAMAPDGELAFAWQFTQLGVNMVRRYSAAGAPLGERKIVSLDINASYPVLAMDATHAFSVLWTRDTLRGINRQLTTKHMARRYAANGIGGVEYALQELPLATTYGPPLVAMSPDGRFTIGWNRYDGPGTNTVLLRSFGADGQAAGPARAIASGYVALQALARSSSGGEAAVFGRQRVQYGLTDLFVHVNGPGGQAPLAATRVNVDDSSPITPAVAFDSLGRVLVSWHREYVINGPNPEGEPGTHGQFVRRFAGS